MAPLPSSALHPALLHQSWDEPPTPAAADASAAAAGGGMPGLTDASRGWVDGSARSHAGYLCRLAGERWGKREGRVLGGEGGTNWPRLCIDFLGTGNKLSLLP